MDSSVQQIKDRLSIVDVVGGYVQLQKAGRNYRARCPFHKERTPSFMVSPERGTYMCFGCGEKGDIFSFIERIDGIDFRTALQQLAERAGVELPKYSPQAPEQKEKTERLYEVCEAATKFFEAELGKRQDVLEYLRNRAVGDDSLKLWHIGYAPASWENLSLHLSQGGFSKEDIVDAGLSAKSEKRQGEVYDRFRGRIMFPIFDMSGKPIAFSGRFFEKVPGTHEEGEPAKYVNSPETDLFKKSKALYGLHLAKETIRKIDCILLVEGQFDVVLSHQAGLKFACAISGTALTPEHLSLLGRLSKRLVLSLDNDEAGLRSGLKSAAMALAAGFDVKIPKIEGGKDPADLVAKDPELLKSAVRASVPAVEFFLDALRGKARDERAYKKLAEAQILPLIAAIPSKIDQAHFVRVAASRLGVPEDAVRAEVGKVKANPTFEVREPASSGAVREELSVLEKNAGMLLLREISKDTKEKLRGLLGSRMDDIARKIEPEAEHLRFEFELLLPGEGSEGEIEQSLMETIERIVIDEEIRTAKINLDKAQGEEEAPLRKKIAELTARKQTLRG